jgi:hypothetical protein
MTARVNPPSMSRVAALEVSSQNHAAGSKAAGTRLDGDDIAGVVASSPRMESAEVARNREDENRQPEDGRPFDAVKARDAIRSKAFLKATIRFQNRNVTLDCVVRNISLGGARLEIDQTFALPAEFELEIPQRGVVFQCALKWRNEHAAGVKFKDSEPPTTPHSTRSIATPDELQRENAELRREVARLGARLREVDGSTA